MDAALKLSDGCAHPPVALAQMYRRLFIFRLAQLDRPEWAQLDEKVLTLCRESGSFVMPKMDLLKILCLTTEETDGEDAKAAQVSEPHANTSTTGLTTIAGLYRSLRSRLVTRRPR